MHFRKFWQKFTGISGLDPKFMAKFTGISGLDLKFSQQFHFILYTPLFVST